MSNKNPKIVIDAIIDSESSKITNEIAVYPVTIRRYAFLEKLCSPFIDAQTKFDVNGIIPSVFIMTLTNEELKKYNSNDIEKIISDSFDWSDSLNIDDVPKMISAVSKQFTEINRASPDATDNNSKKK